MTKDVKKKKTSKKTAKVQKVEPKVTETKEVKTTKTVKKDVKPNKKNVKKVTKQPVKTPKKSYSTEVKEELRKVKWPSKKDITKYGIASIIFIIIFGLYFYGLDALFSWISSLVKGL